MTVDGPDASASREHPEPIGSSDVTGHDRGDRHRAPDSDLHDPHPRLSGYRVTDLSALAGAICWLALLGASGRIDAVAGVDLVEHFVALAVLVLVPLGLGVAVSPRDRQPSADASANGSAAVHRNVDRLEWPLRRIDDLVPDGASRLAYRLAVVAQLPGALAVTAALALEQGSVAAVALVVPWLGVTGAVASVGLLRLAGRGLRPVQELAIDAALLYLPVGAVALVVHQAGLTLGFLPIVLLLTVVHYHYAGFVLPLAVGRVGRLLAADGHLGSGVEGRATAAATLVLVGNLALIAVGITFSPTVELVAVVLFAAAVLAFAAATLVRVVPAVPRSQGVPLGIAFGVLLWTMALAVAYAYSAFPATGRVISIGSMITRHGVVNALGFALPALLALRLRDANR